MKSKNLSSLIRSKIEKGKLNPKNRRLINLSFHSLFLTSLIIVNLLALFSSHSCTRPESTTQEAESALALSSKEIAIRNVVKEEVRYFIREVYTDSDWEEKIIPVGAVHKYNAAAGLAIRFISPSGEKEYHLDAGQAYAFRYDERGELELFEGSHGREDAVDLAPFVPTPMEVVERMLAMAAVTKDDLVYDLGCGDGRIVVTAAKKYGAKGVGIDLDPRRIAESLDRAKREGVAHLVRFEQQDVMKADFSKATVVTLYLLPESNELLRPLLEKQLKPGVRVVSHNYEIPGWEEKQVGYEVVTVENGTQHSIYLYRR
ncbi:MAG: class I SAM-dependent methyltransferase [Candidatus Aminicenantes bacterium]|nr:class I SAM-dependent methyltransferase [Candidatus Aminicenantes bacterium]